MKIQSGSKFLLIGDSITDAGRDPGGEPTPWNRNAGLGSGYAAYTQALLDAFAPTARIRVVNKGCSGNTILDLDKRWQTDVIDLQPDWLSIGIGINDVWRQFDCPLRTDSHVIPALYEETYRRLLKQTRPLLKGLILLTPYVIDTNREDPMRKQMDFYGSIVRRLADEFDATFVDTQAVFDTLMQTFPPTELSWDRVHPGPTGHMALAKALLDKIGFSWG